MTRSLPRRWALGLLLAALPLAPAQAEAEWTVLCYFVGDDASDNPIEDNQIDDLLELDSVGSTSEVNLLVQMDRGKKLTRKMRRYYSDENDSGAHRYRIEHDRWARHATLGEVNSGDPATLYDALRWAAEEFPAKRYALIVNAHGSGVLSWRGVGGVGSRTPGAVDFDPFTAYDDTDDDTLTVFELREVLAAFRDRVRGGAALDLLAFDSCLSLMVETLYEVRNGASVIVGSPSLIPGSGFDYRGIARRLVREPGIDAVELSKAITKTFIDSVGHTRKSQVLGAWRGGAAAEELASSLSRLALALVRARQQHGVKLSFQDLTDYNGRYWDLGRVLDALVEGRTGVTAAPNYAELRDLGREVQDARRRAALSVWYDGEFARKKVGAISVYWPEADEYRKYRDFYKALESSRDGAWDEFLDYRELGLGVD